MSGDEVVIISQALLEVVRHNKLNVANLLLEAGASMSRPQHQHQ